MAAKLVSLYAEAEKLGGLKAKMRMALLTKISSVKAPDQPDSPENMQKFEQALVEIKKEFN